MPEYENSKNREQKKLACFQMQRHLQQMGVSQASIVETTREQKLPYDARMFINGMFTGVVEVKCRNISSDTLRERGSVIVEVERLSKFRNLFYSVSSVTGNGHWNKEVIFLFRCVKDNECYTVHIKEIIRLWDTLEDAPDNTMTDDNGKQQAQKTGKMVPLSAMESFS